MSLDPSQRENEFMLYQEHRQFLSA